MSIFVALVVVALLVAVVILVRRDVRKSHRFEQVTLERDQERWRANQQERRAIKAELERDQQRERADQQEEHVGELHHAMGVVERRRGDPPRWLRSVPGLAWLTGLVTGAWAAVRAAPVPGGAATAVVSAKSALIGVVAIAATTGGIAYAVHVMHEPTVRPPTTATAAAPPKAPRGHALPAPPTPATSAAEAPVAATGSTSAATTTATAPPATTTVASPSTTTPARATPTTTPTTTVTTTTQTTTVAAPTDPTVEATTTPVPTVPPVDPAPGPAGNGNGNGKGHKPPRDAAPHVLCSGLPLLSDLLGPC